MVRTFKFKLKKLKLKIKIFEEDDCYPEEVDENIEGRIKSNPNFLSSPLQNFVL